MHPPSTTKIPGCNCKAWERHLSFAHSLALTHSHTRTHTHTLSLSLYLSLSLSISLSLPVPFSLTHTHKQTSTHTHTVSLSLNLNLNFSLSRALSAAVSAILGFMVMMRTMLETGMNAVERIDYYTHNIPEVLHKSLNSCPFQKQMLRLLCSLFQRYCTMTGEWTRSSASTTTPTTSPRFPPLLKLTEVPLLL